jgi:MFS transporter, DHA2 family, multidrug resistance protein
VSAAAAGAPASKWAVTVSIAFGSLMATIDSSIVNVAVPVLRGELGASIQEITWISTAYMIAMVLVMPLTGFLGAFFGQKRLYLASLALFVAGSALCGMARSLEALIFFRVLQGLGGGALQPTQQAILRQTFPPREQGMAMAIFTMVILIGPAIGPVLGGWLTDNYSWPWIFYINLPVGLLGIFLSWRNVREPEDVRAANRERARSQRGHMDWAGIALMAIGIGALQFLFEEGPQQGWFESDAVTLAAFLAAVGLVAFVIRELTATAPVVNLRLFRDPAFAAANAVGMVMFAMLMGSMFLLPVFMQELQHLPATDAGLALMPRTIAMMILSPIVGRLYNRVGPALLIGSGVPLFMLGSWQLGHVTSLTSTHELIVPLALTGGGIACLFVPLNTAALASIPRPLLADAAGLNTFLRQIGGSIGLTVFADLFTRYSAEARAALGAQVSPLRPELAGPLPAIAARVAREGAVIGFDRTFLLQASLFLFLLPLLYFLRSRRADAAPAAALHAE